MSEISSFLSRRAPTPAASPRRRVANALGGFVITTNDSRGGERCHGGKMASALMKETLSGRLEAGNIARARFRSLLPCKDGAFSNSQILCILGKGLS